MRHRITSAASERPNVQQPGEVAASTLTDEIRAEAKKLGVSAIGFAAYDPKYVFGGAEPENGSVVVCILEQDWQPTQQAPRAACERAVMRTYGNLGDQVAELARFIHRKGFRATPSGPSGEVVAIAFAVAAGLGQLGMNGQLLTPEAGSRCRIMTITTNAELAHDNPVDYGIPKICDECQICARRCPPGAIPVKRELHRGVLKHSIKPERCLPTIIQAHGCAVCMKVCPIQKYGLAAVRDHLLSSGEILGKGTDELEGYDWIDGRHYEPHQHPRLTASFLSPAGWTPIDKSRSHPPTTIFQLDSTRIT
jgi:NAD-dependent dihydropyrimidine dehydrogenase PreA subunit